METIQALQQKFSIQNTRQTQHQTIYMIYMYERRVDGNNKRVATTV